MKIPDNSKLMNSAGSRPISVNSRMRLMIPEDPFCIESLPVVAVCMILQRLTPGGLRAARVMIVPRLLFQIFCICDFVGKFINKSGLVRTRPDEVIIDQVDFQ